MQIDLCDTADLKIGAILDDIRALVQTLIGNNQSTQLRELASEVHPNTSGRFAMVNQRVLTVSI